MKFKDNIKQFCDNNYEYTDKYTAFEALILNVKDKLRTVPYYFRHFSRHDESHSEQIIQYIEKLLGNKAIEELSVSDQVMLVLSSYYHDIGMVLSHKQVLEFFDSRNFADELHNKMPKGYKDLDIIVDEILNFPKSVQECDKSDVLGLYSDISIAIENVFRAEHAKRSAERIKEDVDLKALLGIRGAGILSKICGLHDKNIANIMTIPFEENGFFGDYLHPRFVAGMLCLGDLLDLDTDRFDEGALKTTSEMPVLSLLHKKKHESIDHYLVKESVIEIHADCNSHEVYHTLIEWIDWIREACDYLVIHWDEITPSDLILPPRLKQQDIVIDGNSKWLGYADAKVTIDIDKAIKLLEGGNIYRGKATFIRELIQNAVDATLIQLYKDAVELFRGDNNSEDDSTKTGLTLEKILDYIKDKKLIIDNYNIKGRFYAVDNKDLHSGESKDYESKEIIYEIEDYGTGIDDSEISSIIGMKGKSDALKNLISEIPDFLKPAGIFGIGIQSVFQIAKKIEFITKTVNEKAKVITILDPSVKGHAYVTDYKRTMHRGTRVLVTLDESKFTQNDFGRADYVYQTTPKYKMILTWLFQHSYNLEKDDAPAFEAQRQIQDYFNICLRGYLGDEEEVRDVLKRDSILPSLSENYKKGCIIELDYSVLKYKHYDLEKKVVFDAQFIVGLDNSQYRNDKTSRNTRTDVLEERDIIKEDSDKQKAYGRCQDWHHYHYGHNVFYRNVLAQSGISDSYWDDSILGRLIDFKINLFSGNSDEILNLGRNQIKEEYIHQLNAIVKYEIFVMFKDIIDYCIGTNVQRDKLIFLAFVEAVIYGYRTKELKDKYKDIISKMVINDYYGIDGQEKEIPLGDIENATICFLDEENKEELKEIPKAVWESEEDCKEISDDKVYTVLNDPSGQKGAEKHMLLHRLKGEYYTKIDGKQYHVYETEPYKCSNGGDKEHDVAFSAPYRAPFLIYKEFIKCIFNDLRCILATDGYEILETPLVEGVTDRYRHDDQKAIEIMLQPEIKNDIANMLRMTGKLQNKDEVFARVKKSEVYKRNLDFIVSYHQKKGDGIERDEVEKAYEALYSELFDLLSRGEYFDYVKSNYYRIINAQWVGMSLGYRTNAYRKYQILR